MKEKSIQLGLYGGVGIIVGSLAGVLPFYRLVLLAIGIGIVVGIINTLINRVSNK